MALQRHAPLRTLHFVAKPKKCKHCGEKFLPVRAGQQVHEDCAVPFIRAKQEKARKKAAQAERKVTREKLASHKTLRTLIAEAQTAFNAYIRERDRRAGHACISSGRPLDWNGNAVDAGHFRSRGAAPQLRFDERNCHAQSKHDNRYAAGNVSGYRLGLIERIGLEAVEALEADNTVRKWTREELIDIKTTYRARLRALTKERA